MGVPVAMEGLDLRDYLRMLRRGWPVVALVTLLVIGLAALYLAFAPKTYESTTALFVSAGAPQDIGDLQRGAEFSTKAATTYADIVDSATVLGPVAEQLRPQLSADELIEMVTATARESTTLIDIAATGDDPGQAAAVANATAVSATRVIPLLEGTTQGQPLVQIQQIRPAVEPVSAVSPDAKKVLALGFIVGLCIGLAVTITAQTLDTRIRRVDDVRELTEVPLLAVLPQRARAAQRGLVVRDDPTGAAGEAFRTLRTNVRFLESAQRRSLVFTAVADDRDGALVPLNLAWSLAQAGRRVLLVDLDLRRSTVGEALGIDAGAGLADVLTGRADLPAVIQHVTHPGLRVVLSGTTQASPSDLLSAPILTTVLRRMEQDHDYVILHAPPLLSYTDAAIVSGAAGSTFVTVAAGRNRSHELTTALRALANVRVRPLGLVLTGAPRRSTT